MCIYTCVSNLERHGMPFSVDSLYYSFKYFSLCYKDFYNKITLGTC